MLPRAHGHEAHGRFAAGTLRSAFPDAQKLVSIHYALSNSSRLGSGMQKVKATAAPVLSPDALFCIDPLCLLMDGRRDDAPTADRRGTPAHARQTLLRAVLHYTDWSCARLEVLRATLLRGNPHADRTSGKEVVAAGFLSPLLASAAAKC